MSDENVVDAVDDEADWLVEDPGALPEAVTTILDGQPRHDQALVDRLAGRSGYVMPTSVDPLDLSEYRVNADGVWWHHVTGSGRTERVVLDLVASRPFIMRQRLRDDHGESRYTFAWLTDDDEVATITVPAATAADSRKLSGMFPEVVITSRHAGSCVEYLAQCLRVNREWLVEYGESVATALGWPREGTSYFVSGPDRPVPVEDVKSTGPWLAGHRTRGELDASVRVIHDVADRAQIMVMVAASLAAPLLRPLGDVANFMVDLSGTTTGGKTTSLKLAASMWGEPTERGVLLSWKDTKTSLEQNLSVCRGVPVFVDETQHAKNLEDVTDLIYSLSQGRSKGRSKRDGSGQQGTTAFQTIALITGERPAVTMSEQNGTHARVISVTGQPCRDKEQANAVLRGALLSFGHVGPAFVEHLRQLDEVLLRQRFEELARELTPLARTPVAGRRADAVAVLALANELAVDAKLMPAMTADTWEWLVNGGDAVDMEDEDKPRAMLRAAMAWAASQPSKFHGFDEMGLEPSTGWLGSWRQGRYVAFLPARLHEFLDRAGYDVSAAVFQTWAERGWTITNKGHKTQKNVRLPAGSHKHICVVNLEDLASVEGEVDDGTVGNVTRLAGWARNPGNRGGGSEGSLEPVVGREDT